MIPLRTQLLFAALLPLVARASLSVNLTAVNETCGQANGIVTALASGGTPPYTFQWSNGATTDTINGLTAGWYSVDVTDNVGATTWAQVYVSDGPLNVIPGNWTWSGGLPCPGQCNGGFSVPLEVLNGQQPYSFSLNTGFVSDPSYPHPSFSGFCDMDAVSLTITDGTGCSGVLELVMNGFNGDPILVTNVNGACNGQANGSVVLLMPLEDAIDPWYSVYVRNSGGQTVGGYNGSGPAQVPVNNLAAGIYTIERTYGATLTGCLDVASFVIPAITDCGTVSGDNWYDVDGDCFHDAGEVGIPYRVLEVQPGPEYALTGTNGHYSYNLPNASYTLVQTDPTLIPICPLPQPVPFTLNNSAVVIDLADGSTIPLDLVVNGGPGNASPGFAYPLYASVMNPTPQASGPITVVCTFDALLTYVNAVPTPTSVAGNAIAWDLPALGSFGACQISVGLSVPPGTPLGTLLNSSFSVSNTLTEASMTNNAISFSSTVVGSYDPNEKTARTSSGLSGTYYYIDQDEWIDYTIRFQNTGTAAAIDVVVTDTIPAELDMASFEQGAASHTFDVAFKPGRVVEWRFADINLPDSATDEAASHGLVSFRIRTIEPLTLGTLIENTANIFFDFNDPVITEPSVLVAEFSTAIPVAPDENGLEVFPNPANGSFTVRLSEGRIASVQLLTVDGRLQSQENSPGDSSIQIDASMLAPGTYFVLANSGEGELWRTSLIIY